jgi:heat shock protein HslJ
MHPDSRAALRSLRLLWVVVLASACASGTAGGAASNGMALEGETFLSVAVEGISLQPGTRIRLGFDGGGMQAHAGCNHLGARYRLEDGNLLVGGMRGTKMGCAPALMDQDDWLVALLTSGPAVALTGDTLRLTGSSGVVTLRNLRAVEP